MGGIMKDCPSCDATGKVEVIALKQAPSVDAVNISAKPVDKQEENVHVTETVGAAEAFESMDIPKEVVAQVVPKPEIDEFMQAVLDEPRMKPEDWMAKYKHIPRLFGMTMTGHFGELTTKVQRAAIRANYAQAQVMGERIVDLGAAQDTAIRNDAEYKAYQAQEKKLKESAKKKAVK